MEFGFFKLSGMGGSGRLYFMCWEEFLLLLRVRGRELAKKTRRWGVSGDCDLTCQEKACISWGRSSIFSLNGHLKSKFFGDQWSEETALVHLELCCVYLAKLELYLPKFPSLQCSGGIGVSFTCIFCIRKGRNHRSSLLLCRCRKQGLCWSSALLSAHLSPCGPSAATAPSSECLPPGPGGWCGAVGGCEVIRDPHTFVLLVSSFFS